MATRNDDAVTSLADGRLLEELECAICYEIMTQPTSLTCNHSFCSDCVSGIPIRSNTIRCPVCRKQQRRLDELPQNKQLMVVCNLARHAQEITCEEHAGSALEFYCADCDLFLGHRFEDAARPRALERGGPFRFAPVNLKPTDLHPGRCLR